MLDRGTVDWKETEGATVVCQQEVSRSQVSVTFTADCIIQTVTQDKENP